MANYRCRICKKQFSTKYGLTQHCNAKHSGRTAPSRQNISQQQQQQQQQQEAPQHDVNLWNTPITVPLKRTSAVLEENPVSQNDEEMVDVIPVISEDNTNINVVDVIEPRYNLRSRMQNLGSDDAEESAEESDEESGEESEITSVNLEDIDFDSEDLGGASLEDALDTIEGKNKPEQIVNWPNEAYRDFMELIVEGNISIKIGDKIIKFFNKHSKFDKTPLPSSTKCGKDYLNQINSPSIDFKEKIVAKYSGVDIILNYRPIFRAIQALLQRPEVAENFVYKERAKFSQDSENDPRIYGEIYEGNWWSETEKTLPPLNHLLSIILYSDASTFDGLGKISGHPVFLTLGNLPNHVRNLPEAKVLLGFLPKVQDSGIKTTESFRNLQHEVYQKCFDIMLRPLLEKSNTLYFGIKGREMMFAARISIFLADMLEADEVTATYKSARCKRPCHTCIVLQSDLNNMNISLENMLPRTHENMQQVIQQGLQKEFSVHSVKNTFWKFP
jgi:hypothetical protein